VFTGGAGMSVRSCSRCLLTAVLFPTLLVLATGCLGYTATFGDQVQIRENFYFYFALLDSAKYMKVPEQACEVIVMEPVWSVSEGLTLEETALVIAP
jgi:hypothetical protein